MIDINGFRKWQMEGNRSVNIELGNLLDKSSIKIFVYDYDFGVGRYVKRPEDIDLLTAKKEDLQRRIAELEEFENTSTDSIAK